MIKRFLFYTGGIIIFFAGMLLFGFIRNSGAPSLAESLTLKKVNRVQNVSLVVYRSRHSMCLYVDTILVKEYRASFGRNRSPKVAADDKATPAGSYKICSAEPSSKYHKFLKLNYPSLDDSEDGLRRGVISSKDFEDLKFQYYYEGCVSAKTSLGGNIGIHGFGSYNTLLKSLPFIFDWTDGSIAVSNEDMDELFTLAGKGTKVVIKP